MTRLLYLGDSVGAARGSNFVEVSVAQLRARGVSDIEYVNSSISSSNVLDMLDRVQELLPDREFDVSVIFTGINDSKILTHVGKALIPVQFFAERLEDLAGRLEVADIRVVICRMPALRFNHISSSHGLDEYWHWNTDEYSQYNAAIDTVVKRANTNRAVVDLSAAFRNAGPEADLFEADGVHPSLKGHAVAGEAVANVLAEII